MAGIRYHDQDGNTNILKFVSPLEVRNNVPRFVKDTLNLRRIVKLRPAQRWEFKAEIMPSHLDDNLYFNLFLSNEDTEFTIVVPQAAGSIKNRKGHTIEVQYVNKNTVKLLETSTSEFNQLGGFILGANKLGDPVASGIITDDVIVPEGTFIKINGVDKLFLTKNTATNGQNLSVYPAQLPAFGIATMIFDESIEITTFLDTDNLNSIKFQDGILQSPGTCTFLEKFWRT